MLFEMARTGRGEGVGTGTGIAAVAGRDSETNTLACLRVCMCGRGSGSGIGKRGGERSLKNSFDWVFEIVFYRDENKATLSYTVKPVSGDRPSSAAKAVAQDRWSLITGCIPNHVDIITTVYTYVDGTRV